MILHRRLTTLIGAVVYWTLTVLSAVVVSSFYFTFRFM